jgi:acetyl esterase/lipase
MLVAAALIQGCSPLALLNDMGSSNYQRTYDQAYGPDPRQKLDLYIPTQHVKNADVVIFLYGGRWRSGDKADYRFVAQGLNANGVITVIPNYRLYPQVDWKDFIADAATVYHWVETHIAAYDGNPRRIFLMGHSAGAHIAAMVALDQTVRDQAGSHLPPCGMIGLAGPYDFLPFVDADVRQVFSSALHPMETQPIFYVDRSDPSLLLLSGASDTTVKPQNSYRLADAMQKVGAKAEVIVYPGVAHTGILVSLARPLQFIAPTLKDTMNFIHKTRCGL